VEVELLLCCELVVDTEGVPEDEVVPDAAYITEPEHAKAAKRSKETAARRTRFLALKEEE